MSETFDPASSEKKHEKLSRIIDKVGDRAAKSSLKLNLMGERSDINVSGAVYYSGKRIDVKSPDTPSIQVELERDRIAVNRIASFKDSDRGVTQGELARQIRTELMPAVKAHEKITDEKYSQWTAETPTIEATSRIRSNISEIDKINTDLNSYGQVWFGYRHINRERVERHLVDAAPDDLKDRAKKYRTSFDSFRGDPLNKSGDELSKQFNDEIVDEETGIGLFYGFFDGRGWHGSFGEAKAFTAPKDLSGWFDSVGIEDKTDFIESETERTGDALDKSKYYGQRHSSSPILIEISDKQLRGGTDGIHTRGFYHTDKPTLRVGRYLAVSGNARSGQQKFAGIEIPLTVELAEYFADITERIKDKVDTNLKPEVNIHTDAVKQREHELADEIIARLKDSNDRDASAAAARILKDDSKAA